MDATSVPERRVFVTGAASGIGAAAAVRLAADGARVALGDVREAAAAAVARDIAAAGGRAIGLPCDVTDEASVERAFAAAAHEFGGIDTVVACAGIVGAGATHDMSLASWDQLVAVNLTGVFLTVKHGLRHLLAAGGGALVTVGSVGSLVAAGRSAAYDASKGGVLQLTRAVAVEYADRGVRANCVCPGLVRTELSDNSTALYGADVTPGPVAGRTRPPLERAAHPAEIAGAIAFLCSADASFLTGAAIPVDGGYTAV